MVWWVQIPPQTPPTPRLKYGEWVTGELASPIGGW